MSALGDQKIPYRQRVQAGGKEAADRVFRWLNNGFTLNIKTRVEQYRRTGYSAEFFKQIVEYRINSFAYCMKSRRPVNMSDRGQ